MFRVLVSDPISDLGIAQLVEAADIAVDKKTGLTEDELVSIIGEYDALLVRSQTRVTERIMNAAKQLKVIGRAGVGVDNIDLEAATKRGIIVINAPDGNTITTCEHTFAMMMALARHIPQAYKKTVDGTWDRKSFVGVELRNKVLGVLGMGRIGSEVAKRAKAFGMEIYGYDPFLTQERADKQGVRLASVDDIIRNADFITVHTPLTPETRHMIGREQFERIKPGVRIVNCARGGIIDEHALVEAINSGRVAGAAFDVFEEEPPAADHPFLSHPNIIVTPHLGASTIEAQENVAIDVSEQLLHILRGEAFKNAVNMPPIPADVYAALEPYFTLSRKLGSFVAQLAHGPIKEISIAYAGELADVDTQPLNRYVVEGIMAHYMGKDQVNIVNALHLAKTRGVNVVVTKTNASKGFTSQVSVTLRTDIEERYVSGALMNGFGPRITQIDSFPVDVEPHGHILLISHDDKPGSIGRVGTLLGNNDANIATMQVGRRLAGGAAIMVLGVDKDVSKDVIKELVELPDIRKAKMIYLF